MPQVLRRPARVAHSPFEAYLREINETPLLTAQEEHELACRVTDGDAEARDHLVRANLRLVVNLARVFAGKGLPLQDLIEEGNLGLLRAAEGFDPYMNVRFSTYAAFWIKQSMRRAVVNTARPVRVPAYMTDLMNKWRVATARLREELGRAPSREEVAGRLGLSKKRLKLVEKALRVYNAAPQGDHSDSPLSLNDLTADCRTRAPGAELEEADELCQVLDLIGQMSEREAAVLRLRFGLGGEAPLTLQQIGVRLGLTR